MSPIRSTLAYVVRGGEILLMRRRREPNRGLLSPPGGKLEAGESPERGVIREVVEETGLEPLRATLRGTAHHVGPAPGEEWLQYLFLVREFEGSMRPDHREGTLAWYQVEALLRGDYPVPAADHVYNPWMLGGEASFSCRILHRPDGCVESFERW